MIVLLAGIATVAALVSCDVLRVLKPDEALPRAVVIATAALLCVMGISVVVQLMQLA
ncbi:MAG: hypothetical protein JWO29_1309 [Arthrobacter sp.]|nr:hypothetical protein [Arthrobacter sp.]